MEEQVNSAQRRVECREYIRSLGTERVGKWIDARRPSHIHTYIRSMPYNKRMELVAWLLDIGKGRGGETLTQCIEVMGFERRDAIMWALEPDVPVTSHSSITDAVTLFLLGVQLEAKSNNLMSKQPKSRGVQFGAVAP